MSILKVKGTIDGLTFYKSKDGHLVRTKGGIEKGRIMSDPAFVRTRENISEFGSVAQSGKLFRQAIGTYLNRAKDSRTNSRLLQVMHQLKKMDVLSMRGERQVHLGLNTSAGKQLLKGFDFNQKATLFSVLYAPFESDLNTLDEKTYAFQTITISNLSILTSQEDNKKNFHLSSSQYILHYRLNPYQKHTPHTDLDHNLFL